MRAAQSQRILTAVARALEGRLVSCAASLPPHARTAWAAAVVHHPQCWSACQWWPPPAFPRMASTLAASQQPGPPRLLRPRRPQPPDSAVLQEVVRMAAQSGRPELGSQVMNLLQQHPNIHLFNAALQAAPATLIMPVLKLLCEGRKKGVANGWPKPRMDTVLIVLERVPSEEVDRAMQLLLRSGLKPHPPVIVAWASWHGRRGSIQGVRHVLEVVEEAQLPLAPHCYVQLVRAYCSRGRWKDVEGLLTEMQERGVPPSEHVYRAVIYCLGQHNRADRAQRLFDELVEEGLKPSMPTWAALLDAHANSRQPAQAAELLSRLHKQGQTPSVQVYGALTKAFARSGDWRKAYDVLELMRLDGVPVNEQVYGCIIEAAAVAGKPSVAAELLRSMQSAGIQPNVIIYTSLLSSFSATGDLKAAEAVLQEMEANGCPPNKQTYTEIMCQFAAKGRYQDCEFYFDKMVAAGCLPDKVSYAVLIDSLLNRWSLDREGQQEVLGLVQARWTEASSSALKPHTFLHQPQGRLTLDLHGYSAWTAQLAVLSVINNLLQQHQQDGRIGDHLTRVDIITGRGNRSEHRHKSVLREIVLEMLNHFVPVSFARANDGLLVLEVKHLRRTFDDWLAQGQTSLSIVDMQYCLVNPLGLE